ncbi:MAG: FTR1 family protein [Chloroflexi bacterium]|nr:FTR1 family protein [Chloroflexota bacterium]
MVSSFLLALREGLEAALIIGIVLGTLRKMKHAQFVGSVWFGVGTAAFVSVAVALILNAVGTSFSGRAEEIFEGITMLLAAGILTWMIFWMRFQAKTMQVELETNVQQATQTGGGRALFMVAFLAVMREGIELALFLTAAAAASTQQETLIGALWGLVTAVVLGWILFATTVRLNLERFFQVTSVLLILFAAGLVAHGVHEFNEVGWIPSVIDHLWDTNPILNEKSPLGLMLKALFGYNGNPSLTEVFAYFLYFAAIALGLRRNTHVSAVAHQT